MWNGKFKLPDGSFSVSDIKDYFKPIIRNMKQRVIILQKEYI